MMDADYRHMEPGHGGGPGEEDLEIRAALWSVYYHWFYLRTLRNSQLRCGSHPFLPVPLDQAIRGVATLTTDRVLQRRVIDKLIQAGFADDRWLNRLRKQAQLDHDEEWLKRINGVDRAFKQLASVIGFPPPAVTGDYARDTPAALQAVAGPVQCQVTAATLHACQTPNFDNTGRPITIVTARAQLSQTPSQLARTFDPRSWGTCFAHFQTSRVDFDPQAPTDQRYPPHQPTPDPDPIGQPWPPATHPHLFFERVTVVADQFTNLFENILRVTSFSVTPDHVRLEFTLHESRKLVIPGLGLSMNECVTHDEGYLEATLISTGAAGPVSQVEMVKRAQFVDITQQGSNNPMGLDPGEILNYLAPATLCMWLEDLTHGAVCCQV